MPSRKGLLVMSYIGHHVVCFRFFSISFYALSVLMNIAKFSISVAMYFHRKLEKSPEQRNWITEFSSALSDKYLFIVT